jgi:polyphosphate kinase
MDADKGQSANSQPSLEDRVRDELEDNLDEELELDLGDDFLARLPDSVADMPSTEGIDRRRYFTELLRLQRELIKLQDWVVDQKLKLVVLFEGRDAAGKGGVIKRVTQRLNPRICRTVALSAPTERERTQWYFHAVVFPALRLPSAGGWRDRAVRPQLVQPRRRRARDGLLRRGRGRGILPHRA